MSAAIRQLAGPWQETILPLAERLGAAPVVEVRADDPWSEAGRKVLAGHLGRVLARAAGVVSGEDPEEVHAMRVATRRMRAAMRVFGGAYDRRVTRAHLDDLRLLGGRLGVVRDLDVWLGLLADDARRRSKRDRAGLRVLAAAWEADRAARHADLAAVIASPWFADVATGLAAFVETPGAAARVVAPRTPNLVRDRVPSVLWGDYQAVSAYGAELELVDIVALHQLRIEAKWLRYTLEFVREPLGPPATDLIRRVVILQDQLGEIHDRHAAASSAVAYAAEAASTNAAPIAIGRFSEGQASRVERLRRRLGPAARGVMDTDYRHRLGRAVARL